MKKFYSKPRIISDGLLAELASPNNSAITGHWDDKTIAMLAIAVPEMASELLRNRADAPLSFAIHPAAAKQSVERARTIICDANPIHPRTLKTACQTLFLHSSGSFERTAAAEILREMEAA
jgi:hypothetical protein